MQGTCLAFNQRLHLPAWEAQVFHHSKSLLMKEEREKVALKLNIQTTKIMASSPITSWQTDEETVETVVDFIWGGYKITVDGYWSHEIRR